MFGSLFVVPTPIGNMSDISQRAIDTLNRVDLIAAEDTRHSGQLLSKLDIGTPTISLHDHNEAQRAQLLIEKLKGGMSIALISDAGTPLISDPGFKLVTKCREENIKIVSLPGPCALITALSASGLPTDKFTFAGFLPVKQKAKVEALSIPVKSGYTTIFYESPRRILDSIRLCQLELPHDHKIVLAKELTKTFETYIAGTAQDAIDYLSADQSHQKGEFVLIIYCPLTTLDHIPAKAKELLAALKQHLPPKQAAKVVSDHYKLNKKRLYESAIRDN